MPAIGGAGLNYKGAYSSSAAYNVNDSVQYTGSTYVALISNTNVSPTVGASNATWGLVALAGVSGASSGLTPVVKSAAYTAVSGDLVLAGASAGSYAVTLPSSPTLATLVGVTKTDFTSNIVVVQSSAGIDISGTTNYYLTGLGQYAEFVWDGSLWHSVRDAEAARMPASPPVLKNFWYNNMNNALGTSTTGTGSNVVIYQPYFMPRTATVGSMGVTIGSTSSSTMRLGAFNMDPVTGSPTSIIGDFGTVSGSGAAGTSVTTTGTSAVFPSGWIWLALGVGANSGNISCFQAGSTPYLGAQSINGSFITYAFSTSSGGVFTANPTVTMTGGVGVLIWFKVTT